MTDRRERMRVASCVASLAFMMACSQAEMSTRHSMTRDVTDGTGAVVAVPERPSRIVSLAPDITETLFLLGAAERVVGVTDSCDRPAAARDKPRVGEYVQPSIEAVLLLQPDLVLATAEGNPLATVRRLRDLGVTVFGLPAAEGLSGVRAQMRTIGSLAGEAPRAEALVTELDAGLDAARRVAASSQRQRACLLVWTDPLIGAGVRTFLHEVVDAAGADDACAGESGYPHLSREDVMLASPYVLLLATGESSSGPSPRTAADVLGSWASSLPAGKVTGRVVVLDAPFLRPGPALGAASLRLAGWLSALPSEDAATPVRLAPGSPP